MDKDEALKLALEALQWNWGGEPLPTLELQAINAIKEALAQSDDLTIAYMAGLYDGKNKYASQPKPLTDEQIGAILKDPSIAEKHQGNWLVLPYAYARAIEAAHGIKE